MSEKISLEQFEALIIEYCNDSTLKKDTEAVWEKDDPRWVYITEYAQKQILPLVAASNKVRWSLDKNVEPSYLKIVPSHIASLTHHFFSVLHDIRRKTLEKYGTGSIREYFITSILRKASLEQFEDLIIEYCNDSILKKDTEAVWEKDDPRWVYITEYAQKQILPLVAASNKVRWSLDKNVEPSYLKIVPSHIASLTHHFFSVLHDIRGKTLEKYGTGSIRKYFITSILRKASKEAKEMSLGGLTKMPSHQYKVISKNGAFIYTEPDYTAYCLGSLDYGTIIIPKTLPSISSIWVEIRSIVSGKKNGSPSTYWQAQSEGNGKAYILSDSIEEYFRPSVGPYEDNVFEYEDSTDDKASSESSIEAQPPLDDVPLYDGNPFANLLSAALKVFQDVKKGNEKVALYITFNIMNELKGVDGNEFTVSDEKELLSFLDSPFISFCFMQEQGKTFNIEGHIKEVYSSLDEIRKKSYGYYHKVSKDSLPYSQCEADIPVAELVNDTADSDNPCYKPMGQEVAKSYGWARYSKKWNISDIWNRNYKKLRSLLNESKVLDCQNYDLN